MSSTQEKDAEREANNAIRAYLDQGICGWFFDLYTNHGVRFNEIYRALVHYREPWVDYGKLRSAFDRWKESQPEIWPLQQKPRTPGFEIPPPPGPAPHLLRLFRLLGLMTFAPSAGHLSMPMALHQAHPAGETPRHTDPKTHMRTASVSTRRLSLRTQTLTSSGPGLYYPYYTAPGNQQQHNHAQSSSTSNFTSQPASNMTGPVFHEYSLPFAETTKEAGDESMDNANDDLDGTVCEHCEKVIGAKCQCSPAFR